MERSGGEDPDMWKRLKLLWPREGWGGREQERDWQWGRQEGERVATRAVSQGKDFKRGWRENFCCAE